MRPGDLIFIKGTEGVAWPIKRVTHSPYTHIAGVADEERLFESQALRLTGYEAVQTYAGVADVYSCPRLTAAQRDKIVSYATHHLGRRYDYLLFGLLAVRHVVGLSVPVWGSKQRQICTTLWVDAYRAAGIDLCPGIDVPTPGELASSELLEQIGSY